jgi:hypothetical protein
MVYAAAYEASPATAQRTDFETNGRRGRLVEHWNWSQDTRRAIPVEVYTNCERADLLLNGKSLGGKAVTDRYNPVLCWDVPNEAGTLRVVGYRDGKRRARRIVWTFVPIRPCWQRTVSACRTWKSGLWTPRAAVW